MRKIMAALLAVTIGLLCAGNTVLAAPKHKEGHHRSQMMGAPVHHSMYMQLLAEKYAPDTVDGWKKVMEERTALMKQLHELKAAKQWDHNTLREKMRSFGENNREAMQTHKALGEQLTKAVEAKDEQKIRDTLPKLLASEQKMNEALRNWLKRES